MKILFFLLGVFLGLDIMASVAVEKTKFDAKTKPDFDHQHILFDQLLKKHVKNGFVWYENLAQEKERKILNKYTRELSRVTPEKYQKFSPNQKIAFWVNSYNAFTLKIIIDESLKTGTYRKIKSIKNIGGTGLFGKFKSTFDRKFIITKLRDEKKISLNTIEHKILRKEFKEPRIHFAIVCASISCPKLQSYAFVHDKLNSQFRESGKNFLRDHKKNKYDAQKNIIYLSKIFAWFKEDFGGTEKNIIEFIKKFMASDMLKSLTQEPKPKIEYLKYNWNLNGA